MNRILRLVCLLLLFAPAVHLRAEDQQEPYYGFYPSDKGASHKKFVHNIFGFSMEIPSEWTFGVNGTPPLAVILLYREGLDTSRFCADYETMEIGKLAIEGKDIEEARDMVMRGMKAKHAGLTVTKIPAESKLAGFPSVSWICTWPSKSGFTVTEYITLVRSTSGTRSIAVRTTRADMESRKEFYDDLIGSFKPFAPKH